MMIYGTSLLYLGTLVVVPLSNPCNTEVIYGAKCCMCWTLTLELISS